MSVSWQSSAPHMPTQAHDRTRGTRPRRVPLRKPFSWTWVGVVPFFRLRLAVPVPALGLHLRAQLRRPGRAHSHSRTSWISSARAISCNAYKLSLEISAITALGGALSSVSCWPTRDHRRAAQGSAQLHADLLGCGLELRRRAAGLCLRRHHGQRRAGDAPHRGRCWVSTSMTAGFTIYNFWGLSIVYMYFQFPLMVLIMAPALDGLRREWREACENLGGSTFHYWRYVALPDPAADPAGHNDPALWQRLRRLRHGLCLHRQLHQSGTDRHRRPDPGRCAVQPRPGQCHGLGHDHHHGAGHAASTAGRSDEAARWMR